MLSDSTILTHIARQPKSQAGYKQLVRELGLHGEERRELTDHLQKLVKRGQLIPLDSDRYALPQAAADKNLVAGRLSMHRDGFGFVIPDAKSLTGQLKQRITGDIFIPPHQIGNAMHGDMVLVDITNVRPDGRAEGRIVRPVHARESHGSRHLPLRQPPQLRHPARLEAHARNCDPGRLRSSKAESEPEVNRRSPRMSQKIPRVPHSSPFLA